jgi:hypothetical protein
LVDIRFDRAIDPHGLAFDSKLADHTRCHYQSCGFLEI